ncbi:hypothetical protein TRE132_55120 [Pseudomonas chlororaphis subsp. aurantiaca]|nr:hypothetical protein TRE132_55120 [Pseudomonas chlororaphis subsp. aurantiaca]
MYLLGEQPAYADALINRLQSIPPRLLEGLLPSGDVMEVALPRTSPAALPTASCSCSKAARYKPASMSAHCFICMKAICSGYVEEPSCRAGNSAASSR